jgi:hypothetical protein
MVRKKSGQLPVRWHRLVTNKFKDRSFPNVVQSLEGTIAGVNITTSQGAPGFGPTIKIRGTSSITSGTTPLFVVGWNGP